MMRNLAIHVAQSGVCDVWQVIENGYAVASFSNLDGQTHNDAEGWIERHRDDDRAPEFVFSKVRA